MTDNNDTKIQLIMEIHRLEALAECERAKVGAIIFDPEDGTRLGLGSNTMIVDQCCKEVGCKNVIHAEESALLNCLINSNKSNGMSMICTYSPCLLCANRIYLSGIKQLHYLHEYRDSSGINFLRSKLIYVEEIELSNEELEIISKRRLKKQHSIEKLDRIASLKKQHSIEKLDRIASLKKQHSIEKLLQGEYNEGYYTGIYHTENIIQNGLKSYENRILDLEKEVEEKSDLIKNLKWVLEN